MDIPQSLTTEIDNAILTIKTNPDHFPLLRRNIYVALSKSSDPCVSLVRGWLAIITAKKVLPLFQEFLPAEKMPQTAILLGERIMKRTLLPSSWRITIYKECASLITGNAWGYDSNEIPTSILFSGIAAYKALLETLQIDLLKNLSIYGLSIDQVTDEEIAELETADTAAAAAIALKYRPKHNLDVVSYPSEFGQWWLTEAFVNAWAKACN